MMTQTTPQAGVRTPALLKFNLRDAGTLIGLLIIVVTFSFLSPVFFTLPNLLNILQQSSINALIALGMTLVIISGGIDLSVGPTAALSAVLGATPDATKRYSPSITSNNTARVFAAPTSRAIRELLDTREVGMEI